MENSSHSPEELKKMQEIAIKYMKQLHKQSNNKIDSNLKIKNQNSKKHVFKYHKNQNPIKNLLLNIFKEPDKALILILIVLLMDKEENMNLVLILIYLLIWLINSIPQPKHIFCLLFCLFSGDRFCISKYYSHEFHSYRVQTSQKE